LNTQFKLSVREIQRAVYDLYKNEKGYKWFSLNTFGLGEHEADFLAIHPENNFCVEFEIKRSRSDYFKDFEKKLKHDMIKKGIHPCNQFYFVCERGLLLPEDIPKHLGLITVERQIIYTTINKKTRIVRKKTFRYDIAIEKKARVLHKREFPQHLFVKILTSVMNKYFNEKFKTDK
jgi:hypothetical protein